MPTILAFAGSARRESYNRKLIRAAAGMLEEGGATVDVLELGELDLPLYHGDLEAESGVPTGAREFRRRVAESDGLLLACPEYNSSITPLLKNALDWASRPVEERRHPFGGKAAALLSASPGALGGVRGLVTVRSVLTSLGVLVLPGQASVSQAHQAFDADGRLVDEASARRVRGVCESLTAFLHGHAASS